MRLITIATLAALLAGCVSPTLTQQGAKLPDASALDDPLGGFPDPLVTGHSHSDVASHKLATSTMEELARVDLTPAGAVFGELDMLGKDKLVSAAVVGGFYVIDIKDRVHPKQVSYTPDVGYVADIKSSEDAQFVFLGIQLAGGFTGVHAYNVLVPERPVLVGEFPMTDGCHMLAVHKGFLYCAPNDETVRIFQIVETPATVALVPVGAYAPRGAPIAPVVAQESSKEFTHDMTVQDDPVTGKPVMFVSFWDYGVHVVDVSAPAQPKELGAWKGEGAPDTWGGHIHTTMASLVAGKRVVATIPEYAPVPTITFLDATDYARMSVIGVWAPKKDFGNDAPSTFSTHNFQFVQGKVYLAMYHGGVWVVDAGSVAAMQHPRALGYLLPAAPSALAQVGIPGLPLTSPDVWDVVLKDGVLYASDIGSGVHVLHYKPDAIGDAALTSFA